MKPLYAAILLMCMLTTAVGKPLNGASNLNISTPAEQLVYGYDHEYDLLAQEICPKIKNITDEILKEQIVQNPVSPLMQTLKKNLTMYQQYFPYFKRFGFNTTLVSEFSDMIQVFYNARHYKNDEDFSYIQQLLEKLGYNEIRTRYTEKFKIFFEQRFLKKFEESRAEIVAQSKDREYDLNVLKWITFLKSCQDYECFLVNFGNYKIMHANPFSRLLGEVVDYVIKGLIMHVDNTTIFARAVLTDPKLAQLSGPLKQQLIKNLQDIIKIQEIMELYQIFYLHDINYHVLYKFNDYDSISPKDRQLIMAIFNDHEYKSLQFESSKDDHVESDYIKRYETKKAALSPKELAQMKSVLEDFDRLINASSSEEKCKASKDLEKLLTKSIEIK